MLHEKDLENLMSKAYAEAVKSPDPSSQNGAVLVKRHESGELTVVSSGNNHFYRGIEPEVSDRTKKLQRIEHSERDCIYNAANRGVSTRGTILVCPWVACYDCARAIIGAEISMVVHHRERYMLTSPLWIDAVSEAIGWLLAAGVWVLEYEGKVPRTNPILISGRKWHPGVLEYLD